MIAPINWNYGPRWDTATPVAPGTTDTVTVDGVTYTTQEWVAKTRHEELRNRLDRIVALLEKIAG